MSTEPDDPYTMFGQALGATALDNEDIDALAGLRVMRRSLRAHEHVIREGDRAQYCCLLLTGYAFRHKIAGNGSRQIVSIHMPGDIIDLQNALLGVADHNVQALTHMEVALYPIDAVRELAFERPAIGWALWRYTLAESAIFREWILNIGRRDARTRTAHLLCEIALIQAHKELGKGPDHELPMTQEQLGDALSLTSVHVNRILRGLMKDGLIGYRRRSVTIHDWNSLAEAGDFDPHYLRGLETRSHPYWAEPQLTTNRSLPTMN